MLNLKEVGSLISFISIFTANSNSIISQDSPYLIDTFVDCHNDYGFEGRFKFLDNKAEAYWHLESDNVYFEYYFPSSYWVGIAASNQYIQDIFNFCVDCHKQNQDISHCLSQCLGNNYFIATSKGDNDPSLPWNILEFQIHDNKKNQFDQYQVPSALHSVWGVKGRHNASYNVCIICRRNALYRSFFFFFLSLHHRLFNK